MNNKSFDYKRIAEGYANRPWLHKAVIERIETDCKRKKNFKNGLDVGCGAGLSTKALKLICDKVTGIDIAESMIQVCCSLYENPDYRFYVSSAENVRTEQELYDIVTAAGVINWVNRDYFLKRMNDIMVPGGLLVIYDFQVSDRLQGNHAYTDWYQNLYLSNFPKPPRNEVEWEQQDVGSKFRIIKKVKYQLQYEFTLESFIDFMMLQSNVNIQIEKGEKEDTVRSWMKATLGTVFKGKRQIVEFEAYSWYIEHVYNVSIC